MGQFFILRSRVQQEYTTLLLNALNRVFKSNLSLNNCYVVRFAAVLIRSCGIVLTTSQRYAQNLAVTSTNMREFVSGPILAVAVRDNVWEPLKHHPSRERRLSRVGWVSRVLPFCSHYCPRGKMGTARSHPLLPPRTLREDDWGRVSSRVISDLIELNKQQDGRRKNWCQTLCDKRYNNFVSNNFSTNFTLL